MAVPSIQPVLRPSLATPIARETIEAINKILSIGSSKQFNICSNMEFSFSGGKWLFPHSLSLHSRSALFEVLRPFWKSVLNIWPTNSTFFKFSLKYFSEACSLVLYSLLNILDMSILGGFPSSSKSFTKSFSFRSLVSCIF